MCRGVGHTWDDGLLSNVKTRIINVEKRLFKIIVNDLIFALVFFLVLYFAFWPYRVQGDSMMDTLRTGDRIITSKIEFYLNIFDRGSLMVVNIMQDGVERRAVKRLVGLPGDRVDIEEGRLYVNGNLVEEPYLKASGAADYHGDQHVALGRDEYFFMGDNRADSFDSRDAGPAKKSDIICKVLIKFYPFVQMRIY